jgi:hypothetical protein
MPAGRRRNEHRGRRGSAPFAPQWLASLSSIDGSGLWWGRIAIDVRLFDVPRDDGTALRMPTVGPLLAGDTLEYALTYLVESEHLATSVSELRRMGGLGLRYFIAEALAT